MSGAPITYRSDIDGIRAIAVLAVVAFHAWPTALPGGFAGVDVFFVISGFLISSILFKSQAEGAFSLAGFYFHRVRRIFPALLLVLIALLGVGWFVLLADEYRQVGRHTAAGALFLSNFAFWREAGYFDVQSELKPLLHLWSLGIEEQYYLVWPLFVALAWKRRPLLLALTVVAAILSFGAGIWLLRSHATAAFYLPFGRSWELLAGGLLAWFAQAGKLQDWMTSKRLRDPASVLGALLILAGMVLLDKSQAFPGWRAAVPALGTLLLIAAGPQGLINRLLLSARPLVAVGLISYPLYLWHWPLLSLARILDARAPSPLMAAAAVALAVFLATLTYHLIEKPVRRLPARVCAPTLAAMMVLVAGAGVLVATQKGVPSRLADYQEQVAQIKWALETEPACKAALPVQSRYCRITDPGRTPTAAIIGDSHANRLFDGLDPRFAQHGGNLVQLGEGGCLPFWGLEGGPAGEADTCRKRIDGQLDYLVATPEIGTVFLTGRGPLYISGHGFGEVEKNTRTFLRHAGTDRRASYGEQYSQAMRDTVRRLLAAGKQLVFVIDNPELGFDPLSCMKSRPVQLSARLREPCAVPLDVVQARNLEYRRRVQQIAAEFPALIVVDTHPTLCDGQFCTAMKNGQLLYMDGDHLNRAGTRLVVQDMPERLFQTRRNPNQTKYEGERS